MRVRDVAHHHPAVNQPNVGKRLAAMVDAGLVDRDATPGRPIPRVPAATRTLVTGADAVQTAAALRRSPTPAGLFSHAPAPQPRVPAAVTATSHPSRGR
ncbi:hypothetical protein [Kitasatospora sp. NPDC059599]|uniref:hypothetical protein n=1 Tax=Kitasatospora sp. NPDC059599 TaxID=3346880 RepID=UPI0036C0951A